MVRGVVVFCAMAECPIIRRSVHGETQSCSHSRAKNDTKQNRPRLYQIRCTSVTPPLVGALRDADSQPQQLPSNHFSYFDFLIALASQQVMLIVFDNGFAQLQI